MMLGRGCETAWLKYVPPDHVKGKFVNRAIGQWPNCAPWFSTGGVSAGAESADHIGAACEGVLIAVTAECRGWLIALGRFASGPTFAECGVSDCALGSMDTDTNSSNPAPSATICA